MSLCSGKIASSVPEPIPGNSGGPQRQARFLDKKQPVSFFVRDCDWLLLLQWFFALLLFYVIFALLGLGGLGFIGTPNFSGLPLVLELQWILIAWETENGILSNFSIWIYELNQNWLHACHCNASHSIKWLPTSPCNLAPWVYVCAWHCILYYLWKTHQYFINKQTLIFTENIKIYGRRAELCGRNYDSSF